MDLYILAISAWAIAWKTRGDRWGGLALFNAWAFWLLVTGLPTGAGRLWRRSRWLGVGWALGGLALLSAHYPHALRLSGGHSPAPQPGQKGTTLRVASLNALRSNRSWHAVYAALRQSAPDVILLQELSAELHSYLAARLDAYPHRYWQPDPRCGGGLGVFSRLPFEVSGVQVGDQMRPFALRVTLNVGSKRADLYSVHLVGVGPADVQPIGLSANFRQREDQARQLVAEVRRRGTPALLLGDCNMTEGNTSYAVLSGALTDTWRAIGSGPGWTWPNSQEPLGKRYALAQPLLRLDYCFCTSDVAPLRMQVMYGATGSDHCPIVVDALLSTPSPWSRPRSCSRPWPRPFSSSRPANSPLVSNHP